MNGAVITLARWHARQVIKRQLYAQGSSWRMSKAGRSPSLRINTLTITPRSSPSPLNSTADLLQVADCDPQAVQHLRDLHNGRSAELQGLPLCKYRERNETQGHERPKEIPLHDGG